MPKASKSAPELQTRLRVVVGDEIALGPGKADLLEQIAKTGSIAEAAKNLDMSYMRAWTLVKTMNAIFRTPLVIANRGGSERGGAALSDDGQKNPDLVQGYARRLPSILREKLGDIKRPAGVGRPGKQTRPATHEKVSGG